MTQSNTIDRLQRWLDPLDTAPLECDGLSRCIAMLLRRDGIKHQIVYGTLDVAGVGRLPTIHCWLSLGAALKIDYRARMWLQNDARVPHGVFAATKEQRYSAQGFESLSIVTPDLFEVLTGVNFEGFPKLTTIT